MQLKRKRLDAPNLSGILATRRGALALAVVCALVAAGVLIYALGQYRHAVSTGAKQDTVLVATSPIKEGTAASVIAAQRLYKVTPVLEGQVSKGAIVNAATLSGQIAATNILPGQQLTSADFTTAAVSYGGVVAALAPSERAVSVTLDGQHGLGDVLQAGDHVDVYGSYTVSGSGTVVTLLAADAVALKTPSTSTGSSGTVLLGLSMQLAPRILWVADNGRVWLVLRGQNASNAGATVTGVRSILLGDHAATATTDPGGKP